MSRRVNIFGQPLSYDVGVTYSGEKPKAPTSEVKEGDDLSTVTKDTVVKYTADLTVGLEGTRGNANAFPVTGPREDKSLYMPDGTTPPLTNSTTTNQYVEPSTDDARILEAYSNSALDNGSNVPGDASFVKKGKSASGDVDGHALLREVKPRSATEPGYDSSSPIQTRYVSPILSNNRFTADKKRSDDTASAKRVNPTHPPDTFGNFKRFSNGVDGIDLTDGQMANVGPMLTLRATKELNSIAKQGYGKDGPDGTGASAASLLPGLAQVGAARVSTIDLEASDVLKALIAGGTDPVNVTEGQSGPRKVIAMNQSYGQMNNVLERFSGLLPIGMVAAAVALSVALSIALRAVLAVFLLITNASSSSSTKRDDIGRFIPGNSRFNPAFEKSSFPPVPLPAKLFGLQETVNPYGSAVDEGIKVFFGGDVGDQLQRVLESPGFYANFSRIIVRSATELARIVEDVGTGNPIQIAQNIIAFVDAIKSSKVVAVMNIFAQIGDVSLLQAASRGSEVDNLEGLNAMRNRKPGSLAMAWGATSTKSALLLPMSIVAASRAGSALDPGAKLENFALDESFNLSSKNKLSREVVDAVEKELDSEYVPFYFHDLRTNEIISFNAFLAGLSEDYSANYDSIDGYGRVDSVKMYKNTNRKISVQFFVAATNQQDFDGMWMKVNKLVTLVYPQWSRGTLLQAEDSKFVQPFSQVPSASPVIRMRLGDLWTSNYSKFSLARVFGLGSDSTFSVNGQSHTNEVSNDIQVRNRSAIAKKLADELTVGTIMLLEPGDYDASTKDQGMLGAAASALASVASVVGIKTPTPARLIAKFRVPTKVKVVKKINDSNTAYAVKIADDEIEGLSRDLIGASFIVSKSHLSISQDTFKSLDLNFDYDLSGKSLEDINNFFKEENNAIVKSFESSKGRGLACVIESMGFDWNSMPWETGVAGARAPKMCKVSLSLSVIHDIAPGIDADGFNRAPIYNVGRQSNAMAGNDVNSTSRNSFGTNLNKIRKSLI